MCVVNNGAACIVLHFKGSSASFSAVLHLKGSSASFSAHTTMDWTDLVQGPLPEELLEERVPAAALASDDAALPVLEYQGGSDSDIEMALASGSSSASSLSCQCGKGSEYPLGNSDSSECGALSLEEPPSACFGPTELPVVLQSSRHVPLEFKNRTRKFFFRVPFQAQTQVLLANVVAMATHALLSPVLRCLSSSHARASMAITFVANLVGLSEKRINDCIKRVRDNGGEPCLGQGTNLAMDLEEGALPCGDDELCQHVRGGLPPQHQGEGLPPRDMHRCSVENAVRMALANIVEGCSGLQYERDVARLELSGCVVHWRCRSRHFVRDVEHLAGRIIQSLDAADINTPLGALGIPSDFGILIDPVTIGSSRFARHDTVLMECLSVVSPHTHRIHTPMFGGATLPIGGHTGDALAELTQEVLAEHPAGLNTRALRARCSVVGGDGQVVLGGPAHRHSSSKAAEKLWGHLFPETETLCTSWDYFHRADNACMRGIRQIPAAKEVFDMAAAIDTLFGVGEGRLMMRVSEL